MTDQAELSPKPPIWPALLVGFLVLGAFAVYRSLDKGIAPPPAEIANDPFLVQGREIFVTRCASCHGASGRGDGPLAKGLNGPKPRDFIADEWKYGTRPDQVLKVVTDGVPGTSMSAWKSAYSADELKAVTAYLFLLAKRPVPDELRPR